MATFSSSSMKSGSTLNVDTLISHVDSLAAGLYTASSGSLTNTTSASYVALVTKTLTVTTTDMVVAWGQSAYSTSNGKATEGRFAIFANGANISFDHITNDTQSNSAGQQATIVVTPVWVTGLSGSIDYDLRWYRSSGGGTVYSGYASLYVMVLKSKI